MGTKRENFTLVSVEAPYTCKLFTIGGTDVASNEPVAFVEFFDFSLMRWSISGTLNRMRISPGAVAINHLIYVLGGYDYSFLSH